MPFIKIPQKDLILEAPSGENLMTFLHEQQLPVASSCLGEGVCSMCKLKITGNLKPAQLSETETLRRNKCDNDERLSCQITIESDLVVQAKYW